jgi:hypothetical protein
VRRPVPVTIITSELPLVQPGRSTISLMTGARSGVRWLGPISFTTLQGGGDQPTLADVLGLWEMLRAALVKVGALSLACPAMVRETAPVVTSSARNCM